MIFAEEVTRSGESAVDFDEREFEAQEIRRTKLLQVACTGGSVLSVLLGAISGFQWFVLPLYACILGCIAAFETRIQPKGADWRRYKKFMAIVIGMSLLISFFVFPSDPDCYVDWDGRSNPVVCD